MADTIQFLIIYHLLYLLFPAVVGLDSDTVCCPQGALCIPLALYPPYPTVGHVAAM
jgi:hypothetical protein